MIDIAISGLVKEFEVGKKILDGLTFQVDSGERVGLLGKNGCGKTTLLRILTGQLDWDEGEVVLAPDKRVGLISQIPVYPAGYTVEDVLDTAFRPLREMEEEMEQLAARMERGEDPALLRRYDQLTAAFEAGGGYDTDTRKNKVCSGLQIGPGMREQLFDRLSGGEKTRVNLGRLILEDTDILLLDEPTNHLDIQSREWIEEAVEEYEGNLLFVSHDRYFIDRFATRVWVLEDGQVTDFRGSYGEYRAARERKQAQAVPAPAAAPAEKKEKPRRPGGTKNLEKEVAAAERAVAKAEEQMYELGLQIEEAAADYLKLQELYEQREALEEEILKLYGTWERLSAELEEARG